MNDSGNPLGPATFDWLNPDYQPVWAKRVQRMAKLRADPGLLAATKVYYSTNPADFVNDWGTTVDTRNVSTNRPTVMPFMLFPLQYEFLKWIEARRLAKEDGVLVKSRDCGASWLAMSYSCWFCMFHRNVTVGFGSATEEKVDSAGNPDSLFYKGRKFMEYIPREFSHGWNSDNKLHSTQRHIMFPWNESAIIGQIGDRIGRGGRSAIFFVDEFAVVEHSKVVDANLTGNTPCRIEMSTVQGISNVFAEHARGGLIPRFDFHYRDDPRKAYRDEHGAVQLHPDFKKEKAKRDPIVWNQEYECDFLASAEGIIIPQIWVQAAIGAAAKLGIEVTGDKRASFDVADMGKDKNALAFSHGVQLEAITSWSGSGSTIGKSVERVYGECEHRGVHEFAYDGDGMGAGVRSDCVRIEEEREKDLRFRIFATMFRGSGAVIDPENICPGTDRLNKDFFENQKAQSWWSLRQRFRNVWEWVINGIPCDPSDIISINPSIPKPDLDATCAQLSQPVWKWSKSGKMMIDKVPDDVASPNNADAVMMLYPYARPALDITDDIMALFGGQDRLGVDDAISEQLFQQGPQ